MYKQQTGNGEGSTFCIAPPPPHGCPPAGLLLLLQYVGCSRNSHSFRKKRLMLCRLERDVTKSCKVKHFVKKCSWEYPAISVLWPDYHLEDFWMDWNTNQSAISCTIKLVWLCLETNRRFFFINVIDFSCDITNFLINFNPTSIRQGQSWPRWLWHPIAVKLHSCRNVLQIIFTS